MEREERGAGVGATDRSTAAQENATESKVFEIIVMESKRNSRVEPFTNRTGEGRIILLGSRSSQSPGHHPFVVIRVEGNPH